MNEIYSFGFLFQQWISRKGSVKAYPRMISTGLSSASNWLIWVENKPMYGKSSQP